MIETELFCDLADTILDTENKMKTLIIQLIEKSLPKGYSIRSIVKLEYVVGYSIRVGKHDNLDKEIICDFRYDNKQLNIHTACVNFYNRCYVYSDKPYHLKCSNAEEIFPYDEAKLTETFKIFDSLTKV